RLIALHTHNQWLSLEPKHRMNRVPVWSEREIWRLAMYHRVSYRLSLIAVGALLAVLGWPNLGAAQTVSGQARAVQASVTGIFGTTTTMLADTGTLAD